MCGINGYLSFDEQGISAKEYYQAHLTISHRGPDDEGFLRLDGSVVEHLAGSGTAEAMKHLPSLKAHDKFTGILGHRRLSILDLSTAGHQPYSYENLHIVYNGEIYNYLELRRELESLGYDFLTSTDTEVFLKAYHCWGRKCFNRFNGMWAAAIYCTDSEELILTRDRFGVKPLYYYLHEQQLYFASEIKFFRELGVGITPRQEQICHYLRYAMTDYDEFTFFEGILQVLPGHLAVFNRSGFQVEVFWDMPQQAPLTEAEMKELMLDAVRLRMRSDVNVGALLSGGVDSSAIVGIISEHKLVGTQKLHTYSAVFDEEAFSEKKYIDATVSKFGLSGHFIYPKPKDLLREIDELLYIQDFPIRSLGIYSQYKIYQSINSQGEVKVLLNGQGADEVFSGYSAHFYAFLSTLLIKGRWGLLFREVKAFSRNRKIKIVEILLNWFKQGFSERWGKFNKSNIFKCDYDKPSADKKFSSPIKQTLWSDLSLSALREYLRYEDRNSMAFSVESRLPYLDYRLVTGAFSLPEDKHIKQGILKQFLRKLVAPYLHKSVLERKDKMGFASPQELWQKRDLLPMMEDAFKDIRVNGLFDFLDSEQIYQQFVSYCEGKHNDWLFIWRIFCLYRWKKVWFANV